MSTVDAINAEIGAGVLSTLRIDDAIIYRIELPADLGVDAARTFYMSKPEVVNATWVLPPACPA